jgi:hypothetical protein
MSKKRASAPESKAAPQSKSLTGIAAGIGLLNDGTLNVFVPGSPPSRWFEARNQDRDRVFVRVDYGIDGKPARPPELGQFELGAETENSQDVNAPGWIRDGVLWKKVREHISWSQQ